MKYALLVVLASLCLCIQGPVGPQGAPGRPGETYEYEVRYLYGVLNENEKSSHGDWWDFLCTWDKETTIIEVWVRVGPDYMWHKPTYFIGDMNVRILDDEYANAGNHYMIKGLVEVEE